MNCKNTAYANNAPEQATSPTERTHLEEVFTPCKKKNGSVKENCKKTEKPYYIDLMMGVDYALEAKDENGNNTQNNFSDGKFNIGLTAHQKFNAYESADLSLSSYRGFLTVKLASASVEIPENGDSQVLTEQRSLGIQGGLFWGCRLNKDNQSLNFQSYEIGPIIKFGGQTSEIKDQLITSGSLQVRILQTGKWVNGAYLDVGYGFNGALENEGRWKLDAFLPIEGLQLNGSYLNLFLATSVESDLGNKKDLVTFSVGTFIDFISLGKALGNIFSAAGINLN